MEKIKIENLTFKYPLADKPALENVSFGVNSGEFVVVCGKSGGGKSTLLKSLKPALAPCGEKTGKIYFDSRDISLLTQTEQTKEIGFVMQNPDNQIVCDKVWHELAFTLESLHFEENALRARVAEMASYFGIQSWFHKNTFELSGGQKQLLALASVMATDPSVIILDEPTGQLDPIASREFIETVFRLNRELGITVIMCEHKLEEVFEKADRIIVINDGKIEANGSPREVGKAIKESGSDMIYSLPTPMRVYYGSKYEDECPITVREARSWLSDKNTYDVCGIKKKELSEEVVFCARDIWFRYAKDEPDILKGLSFEARKGEIYAIVGANGSGKTTLLSIINSLNKPYRGKTFCKDEYTIATVPQNPQTLFTRKTVLEELEDALAGDNRKMIAEICGFCMLEDLLQKHPYDLSGGEQQRVAIAMVLLKKSDILILDEPTKGLDAHFKRKLAKLLLGLKKKGKTIIVVSHDIEFCAEYADRCAMLFDGRFVSESCSGEFFLLNKFYTTVANRMSRGIIENAVLDKDILRALGEEICDDCETEDNSDVYIEENKEGKARIGIFRKITGTVFLLLFVWAAYFYFVHKSLTAEILSSLFLAIGGIVLIPHKKIGVSQPIKKKKLGKRGAFSVIVVLILIPITVFWGIYCFNDRKYYFISLLVILEAMLPFVIAFENRKPQAREIIIISVLCALAVAGRMIFAPFPQFKPAVAIVIISGLCFGGETGFLVGAAVGFLSNFYFGQGPWTPWQMFSFGIIGFVAGVLFQKGVLRKTRGSLCLFGFFATIVIYGGIMNASTVVMQQNDITKEMIMSTYIMGFPFDVIHAMSTVYFLWLGAEPICEKLERVKIKYKLSE